MMRIGWMFPGILGLNGDRGNILAIERYLKIVGIDFRVNRISYEDEKSFNPFDYDLLYFGTGEISSFNQIIKWLSKYNIKEYIDAGKIIISTGTTSALFTKKIVRDDKSEIEALGIINIVAIEKEYVYGDDEYYKAIYNKKELEIIGNQIQLIDYDTKDTPKENIFGELIYGYGNNGDDNGTGFIFKNSLFLNTLGPVLALNPWLTIEIIKLISGQNDVKLDFPLQEKSFKSRKKFIMNKETHIKDWRK